MTRKLHHCRRSHAAATFLGLCAVLLMTGCQEDTRASKLDSKRASEVAGSRLKQAQGDLLATLGQSAPGGEPAEKSTVPGSPKTLVWSPPLTREDGTALSAGQIAGYRIYFRLKHQDSFRTIPLNDPGVTRYVLAEMPPGAYEFSITTVDQDGLESRRSDPVEVNLI
ncbi:fibronectin type III domain-containing protein [Marinobacter sp. VGCF2001]|uniref:fibronectin type III domain-containing protein n=1 Tax=Marinobacter sp. VGCF2001 TaxID=3417189 RepID=UPI003CEACE20